MGRDAPFAEVISVRGFGESALFWFIEAFTLESKYPVGACAVILPGNGCRQFDQLCG